MSAELVSIIIFRAIGFTGIVSSNIQTKVIKSKDFYDVIVTQTNLYSKQQHEANPDQSICSRIRITQDVTSYEIKISFVLQQVLLKT